VFIEMPIFESFMYTQENSEETDEDIGRQLIEAQQDGRYQYVN
jgi:hypothetical protein